MNIDLVCMGKLKDKWEKDAFAEYVKRLGAYGTVKCTELKECRLSESPSPKETERALCEEAQRIREQIPKNSAVIAMCIEGKKLSSEGFAEKIESFSGAYSGICLVIGSSYGLSDDFKKEVQLRLSMSDMTFPHRLARIMAAEQLYRAFSINAGSKYHK